MPPKTYRRTKRNREREALIAQGVPVVWHHKMIEQVEGMFQLALQELATLKESDSFTVYRSIDAKRERLKARVRDGEDQKRGEVMYDAGGQIVVNHRTEIPEPRPFSDTLRDS